VADKAPWRIRVCWAKLSVGTAGTEPLVGLEILGGKASRKKRESKVETTEGWWTVLLVNLLASLSQANVDS